MEIDLNFFKHLTDCVAIGLEEDTVRKSYENTIAKTLDQCRTIIKCEAENEVKKAVFSDDTFFILPTDIKYMFEEND